MTYKNPTLLFHGKRFDVLSIEGEGGAFREVVVHPGAVVILPILDEERILLIRNRRDAVEERLWELPAGTLERDEEPLRCAMRELEEETGYKADEVEHLFDCYSTPGFCNEKLFVYKAASLSYVGQRLDETEEIEVGILKLDQVKGMILSNEICDAKTISALLFYWMSR